MSFIGIFHFYPNIYRSPKSVITRFLSSVFPQTFIEDHKLEENNIPDAIPFLPIFATI